MKRYTLFVILACSPHLLYAHEMLDNFLQDLHSLQAKFEQTLYDESGDVLEKTSGEMYMQRPNKFRWIYQIPYNQLIVADGKKVWIYDSDLEQVTSKHINDALGKTPAFLLNRPEAVEKDFRVTQLPSKTVVTRLHLVPKDTEAQFESININLYKKILLSFELMDNFGQITYIKFRHLVRNKKLNPNLFIFTPPADVDIIEDN